MGMHVRNSRGRAAKFGSEDSASLYSELEADLTPESAKSFGRQRSQRGSSRVSPSRDQRAPRAPDSFEFRAPEQPRKLHNPVADPDARAKKAKKQLGPAFNATAAQ